MMGALKTKMEEQLELSEDGRLQKESTNKVRGIMEENKITERQEEAEEWELAKEFHEVLTSQNTLYWSGCLGWSNANICNEIEKGQMEEYKKKERQKEAKETQFANRKLLLEEITNNERNEMEEAQMEENEIKEGHDDVDEKQDNKAEETLIANRKLLLEKITNNERNEMKEEPLEEIEIKEGHEVVEEEQDIELLEARLMMIERGLKALKDEVRLLEDSLHLIKAKETPIANRELMEEITNDERNDMEEEQMEEIEIKEGHDDVEEEQDNKITMPIFNFCGNLLNEERGQVEGNKIEEGQEEVQEEQDNERAKWDHYLRMRFCRAFYKSAERLVVVYNKNARQKEKEDCQRDHLRLSTKPTLMDIEMELTEISEEQLGRQLFISEEQLGRQLFFQGGQSRRKLFERTIKTTLVEMMGKWKQREGNAVVEDDAIMEREKQTDVTEKLSGEFDDEEKEKRELEQLLRCKVCLDSDACVVLFPCRHMATCEYCEGFLQCCPVCRSFIDEAVKVNEEN